MQPLVVLATVSLYAVMAISVGAALGVVLFPNIFHAALALAGVLFGTAVLYLALHAEFLAVVQVLLYVGAVMTLVIFAVMLTTRIEDKTISQHNQLGLPGLVIATALFTFLTQLILKTPWPVRPSGPHAPVSLTDLGQALMGPYILPFEVIAVLLTAALVGAIVIARKDRSP